MHFPGLAGGGPYARFDGRTGDLILSSAGEGLPDTTVPSIGKVLAFDVRNAKQGWLRVNAQGADWQQLAVVDEWGTPPSSDHNPAVDVPVYSEDPAFGEERTRSCRGSSKAFLRMFTELLNQVGADVPADTMPTIRISACEKVQVGAGTSTDIKFDLAPRDRWLARPVTVPTTTGPDETDTPPPAEGGSANW